MKPLIERINEFCNYQDNIDNKGIEYPTFEKYIDISNLSFSYTEEKEILKGINLKIERNKRYAIVGGSGSGKSTLIKLMLGYYSEFNGQINYDGKEFKKTPILVLDEGTSAIDMQTAYEVEKGLLDIKDLTLITITHKMTEELLDLYDEIIYMDNGYIVEKGSLKELLDKKGDFYSFYNLCIS